VFEPYILDRYNNYLGCNVNQFGFNECVECSQAVYDARNIANHFFGGGSIVNLCALHLSKACDKINHCALVIKLMKRHLPVLT